MKDTILNSVVIATAFSAILMSVIGDFRSEAQTAMAQAPRVVEMEKTVVAAKRLSPEVTLIAFADE